MPKSKNLLGVLPFWLPSLQSLSIIEPTLLQQRFAVPEGVQVTLKLSPETVEWLRSEAQLRLEKHDRISPDCLRKLSRRIEGGSN